jgi:hypothetical protein
MMSVFDIRLNNPYYLGGSVVLSSVAGLITGLASSSKPPSYLDDSLTFVQTPGRKLERGVGVGTGLLCGCIVVGGMVSCDNTSWQVLLGALVLGTVLIYSGIVSNKSYGELNELFCIADRKLCQRGEPKDAKANRILGLASVTMGSVILAYALFSFFKLKDRLPPFVRRLRAAPAQQRATRRLQRQIESDEVFARSLQGPRS